MWTPLAIRAEEIISPSEPGQAAAFQVKGISPFSGIAKWDVGGWHGIHRFLAASRLRR